MRIPRPESSAPTRRTFAPSFTAACIALSVAFAGFATARDADAHARLKTPAPRSTADGLKDMGAVSGAPCGGVAKTNRPTVYRQGQTITVDFEETINHPGCFLFALLSNNDTEYLEVKNVKQNPAGATPRPYTTEIQLPANMTCTDCTLQMRQIMLANNDLPCPPNPIPLGVPYYSCADIQITVDGDAGALPDGSVPISNPNDGGGGASGQDADEASGAGGSPPSGRDAAAGSNADPADDYEPIGGGAPGACSLSPHDQAAGAFAFSATLFALLVGAVRRRKR
jgi:hypothetical protein